MRPARLLIPVLVLVSSIALIAILVHGQGSMDRIKQKAKEKVQQRTDQVTDSVTDAAVNGTEKAVKCAIGNLACIREAEAASQQVAIVNAKGEPVSTVDSARAITAAANSAATPVPATSSSPGAEGAAVNVNQDFTPGSRVIWATDFASDPVGNFPRRLELKQGNFETASWNGKHLLRTTSGGDVVVPMPEVLPAQFTLEFDYTGSSSWSTTERFSDDVSMADVELVKM